VLIKQKENALLKIIKSKYPFYYQHFVDSSVVSLDGVRNTILKDYNVLIEFFEGDSAVYVLTVSAQKTSFRRINKAVFDSIVTCYKTYLADNELAIRHPGDFITVSYSLYRLIFEADPLPNSGRFIISPDKEYFPFDALIINKSGRSISYFLNRYAISYTYSARFLMTISNGSTNDPSNIFFGVAPIEFEKRWNMADLYGSSESLDKIFGHFNSGSILTLENATKASFLKNYSKYKLIQLYAHASVNGRNGEPEIYFFDSVLYLSDILEDTQPVTGLIVLSGCKTANGKVFQGEGVFSFNRGFAAVGVPSCIANLWEVEDKATYKLTEYFYNYLSMGIPSDLALQKAKIEFIKSADPEKKIPYYWAATILVGKSMSIEHGEAFTNKSFLLFILIAIAVAFILKKYVIRSRVKDYISSTKF